jgi:hypothetical protein
VINLKDPSNSTPVRTGWRILVKIAGLALAVITPFQAMLIHIVTGWVAASEYPLSARQEYKEPQSYGVVLENTSKDKLIEDVQAYVSARNDALTIAVRRNNDEFQHLAAKVGERVATFPMKLYAGDRLSVEVSAQDRANLVKLPKIDFQAKGIRGGELSEIQMEVDKSKAAAATLHTRITEILLLLCGVFCLGAVLIIWRLESTLRHTQEDANVLRTYLTGKADAPR